MEKVLYHYTCKQHLPKIMADQHLKLTDSNLIAPDGTIETEIRSKNFKPVVWLTDSESPQKMGLEGSCFDKTEIKITMTKKDYMVCWLEWEPRNEMPDWWKRRLCKSSDPERWYIAEQIIPFSDILKIENRYNGKVYYDSEHPEDIIMCPGECDFCESQPHVRDEKIYPNDPCPCGSGKKYKKCCGRN